MSAFVVNETHIHALVTAGIIAGIHSRAPFRWYTPNPDARYGMDVHELRDDNASEVGQMLWYENVRSVRARYPEDGTTNLPGPIGFNAGADPYVYTYKPLRDSLTPVETLSALACYEYQSCEHDDWRNPQNIAAAFCRALQGAMIRMLPGYDSAPWEVPYDRPTIGIYRRVV